MPSSETSFPEDGMAFSSCRFFPHCPALPPVESNPVPCGMLPYASSVIDSLRTLLNIAESE